MLDSLKEKEWFEFKISVPLGSLFQVVANFQAVPDLQKIKGCNIECTLQCEGLIRGWVEHRHEPGYQALDLEVCSQVHRRRANVLRNTWSSCRRDLKQDSKKHPYYCRLDRRAKTRSRKKKSKMKKESLYRTRIDMYPSRLKDRLGVMTRNWKYSLETQCVLLSISYA